MSYDFQPSELHDLIDDYLEGTISDANAVRLSELLEQSAEARAQYWEAASIHGLLEHVIQGASLRAVTGQSLPAVSRSKRRTLWHTLAAVVAGLMIGILGESVVLAYIVPAIYAPTPLLDESFEQLVSMQAEGVPRRPGVWGGDFAEIVDAKDGLVPHSGSKAWRFLRADNDTQERSPISYVGEAIHVVDLKPLRQSGVQTDGQLEISAWFAEGMTPAATRFTWNIKSAAFKGDVATAPDLWKVWDQASLSFVGREIGIEPGGQWQQLSVLMQLPKEADFVVFECTVVQREPLVTGVAEFPAHYLDDVQVRLHPPRQDGQSPK